MQLLGSVFSGLGTFLEGLGGSFLGLGCGLLSSGFGFVAGLLGSIYGGISCLGGCGFRVVSGFLDGIYGLVCRLLDISLGGFDFGLLFVAGSETESEEWEQESVLYFHGTSKMTGFAIVTNNIYFSPVLQLEWSIIVRMLSSPCLLGSKTDSSRSTLPPWRE